MEWGSFFIGFLGGAVVAVACCWLWAMWAMSPARVFFDDEHGEDYEL